MSIVGQPRIDSTLGASDLALGARVDADASPNRPATPRIFAAHDPIAVRLRLALVAALPARLVLLAVLVATCSGPAGLVGTELGAAPAPDFTLTDALTGEPLALSTLRGSVVALAFLYTNCPDTCPLTAEQFREAQKALGPEAERVRFVAVSVDPVNDTPESVRTFSADHRLDRNWHYLIGERSRLEPVWALYGVGAFSNGTVFVSHNDAIFLIDARGRERVLVHTDTPLDDLTNNLRLLVREPYK
jgi:protein SCO1/2